MKYFEEYQTKFGFGDGDNVPPDAEAHWVQNQRIMNALLEKHGSNVRLVCWFRCGMHNPYLLIRIPQDVFDGLEEEYRNGKSCEALPCFSGRDWKALPGDEGYDMAFEEAEDLECDGMTFVEVDVELDGKGLDAFCNALRAGRTAEEAWRECTGPECRKCGSALAADGLCPDETCPYSDRQQHETFTEE